MGRKKGVQQPDAGSIVGILIVVAVIYGFTRSSESRDQRKEPPAVSTSIVAPSREPQTRSLWVNTANDPLVLREGPSSDARVVTTLPRASQVESTGGDSGQFTEVRYRGNQGWAASQYLSTSAPAIRESRETGEHAPGPFIPYHGNGKGPTPCADGTWSRSSGRGTCSHHGGIRY